MAIWKFKSCPRCRGDVFVDRDLDSWNEHCLQCGYLRYLSNTVNERHHSEGKAKKELVKPLKQDHY